VRHHDGVAKYDPLREHLRRQGLDAVTMTVDDVAAPVPGELPASAYAHKA
jgi:hypothetical protein